MQTDLPAQAPEELTDSMIFHKYLETVTDALGHLVWPITLLLILFYFRKNFTEIFKRLSAIKADTTGIALNFERQLSEVEELSVAHASNATAKSGASVAISPHEQLLVLRNQLHGKLANEVAAFKKDTEDKSISDLFHQLIKIDRFATEKEERFMKSLIDLVNTNETGISQAQVNRIKLLFQRMPI